MVRKPNNPFAKQIGSLVPSITKASFERYGFAYADLASKWEAIMGKPLCEQCLPKKIVWPRGVKHENERVGGTLHLICLSAFALDLQHSQDEIIERINRFYGYKAISKLSLVQTSRLGDRLDIIPDLPPLTQAETEHLKESMRSIEDPDLSQALEDLGATLLRSGKKK